MAAENLAENPATGYNTFEPPQAPPYTGPDEQQPPPNFDEYQSAPPSYPQVTQRQTIIAVVQRPPVVRGIVVAQKPNNYMAFSLINFLFCCMCFGIAAITYSLKVDSEYAAGRIQEAIIASQTAKRLNILGVIVGVTINLMVIISIIVAVIVISDEDDDDYYNDNY